MSGEAESAAKPEAELAAKPGSESSLNADVFQEVLVEVIRNFVDSLDVQSVKSILKSHGCHDNWTV